MRSGCGSGNCEDWTGRGSRGGESCMRYGRWAELVRTEPVAKAAAALGQPFVHSAGGDQDGVFHELGSIDFVLSA